MSAKFKWGLLALALVVSNEVLTWAILLILAAPVAWNLMKEASEHD